jgi:hypothetical protein
MADVIITAGEFRFEAVLERADAPLTSKWFEEQLPLDTKVIHARWSGEAVWMPLGDLDTGLPQENHTNHPSRGDVLFYPGGISEAETLFVYGSSVFMSKVGPLAGNHFLTITSGREDLPAFGEKVLWGGATDITFATAD